MDLNAQLNWLGGDQSSSHFCSVGSSGTIQTIAVSNSGSVALNIISPPATNSVDWSAVAQSAPFPIKDIYLFHAGSTPQEILSKKNAAKCMQRLQVGQSIPVPDRSSRDVGSTSIIMVERPDNNSVRPSRRTRRRRR